MKHFNTIKKVGFLIMLALLGVTTAQAQLSGTYTIGGTSPDYTTLSAAISDLNASGVSGPVIFNIRDGNYTGSSWRGSIGNVTGASTTNTITFQSQSGNAANCVLSPAGSSTSNNYVFQFDGARYITIKNLTLNNTGSTYGCDINMTGSASNCTVDNCVLTGSTSNSTSTYKSRIYANGFASGSNMTFTNNTISYGTYGVYLRGNGSTTTTNGHTFENNVFSQQYYYCIYMYYCGDITIKGNEINKTNAAYSNFYGIYNYFNYNKLIIENNTLNINPSSGAYYLYPLYTYYANYYSNSKTSIPEVKNNTFNVSVGSSTYYLYPVYNYRPVYGEFTNNTFNVNHNYTSGYMYDYFIYYGDHSVAEQNTFNYNKTGGYIYARQLYYGNDNVYNNNTLNMTGNAYSYNYAPYYSTNYTYTNNHITTRTTNRTSYGAYLYQYSGTFAGNTIDCENSSGGTVYGMYVYYQQGSKIYNNVVRVKSSSTCRNVMAYYNYSGQFYNNTLYNESTSSSSYNMYVYHSSSSYDLEVKNNIMYKTSGNGYNTYCYNSNYVEFDYNLYYKPSGNYFQRASPSKTADDLQDWRTTTGDDMNSLIYSVPFNDPSNLDFSIVASSPAAWAVNGRGIQDTSIKTDYAGNPRPFVRQDGVPDLGAYEVTPTSTPPYADAYPSVPAANSTQTFVFAQDTVATIDWGASVPNSYSMRQYTGVQAGPMPAGVGRMYFYTTATTPGWEYDHKPHVRYKEPWLGDISTEANAVIARSSNGGTWEGYNYTNASTDIVNNRLAAASDFDSLGAYTGVENGRIGIRCVVNPTGIAISNITADEADVDWDAVFNPIGYQVYVSSDPTPPTAADWNSSATTNAPSNTVGLSGLDEDTKYYVYIRSICGVNDTSGASVDSFITLITCHDPQISLSSLNSSRVIASWQDVKTAEKYEYVIDQNPAPPAFGIDIYKTNVLAPYLDAGTTYYVHVRTHCNSIYSNSGWSTTSFNTWATGINNVTGDNDVLNVYPNPATEVLTVELGVVPSGNASVSVMDLTGKVLSRQVVSGSKVSVSVSELPSGVYLLQYADDAQVEQIKFNKK